MSVGDTGGLDTFDEDAAIANLAAVGQGAQVGQPAPAAQPVPGQEPPPVLPPATVGAAPQDDMAGHLQPGEGGVDVYNLGNPHDLEPLGQMPQQPAITGNHQLDVKNNLQFSRDLAAYQAKLQQHQGKLAQD